jgi:hypothetical protein
MKLNKHFWLSVLIVAGISALAYLPLIHKFGYFNDDWYLMYDVRTQGAPFFHNIFSSDRPGRAFLMIPLYSLFGLNPLPYNLSAYLFRVLGGAALLWILNILWPHKRFFILTTAILFTIYPGFLSQHNAIDYQSHILALFLALLSVALTLKAILAADRRPQILFTLGSILSGWGYLSQMEYFIGVEAFRVACVFLLVWRSSRSDWGQAVRSAVLKWLPFAVIPAGFLFWRVFYFQTERRATDIGFQVGQLFTSPTTGVWWLTYLIQDLLNVMLVAWGLPLSLFVFPMRLQNLLVGFGLAALAVLLFVFGSRWVQENESEMQAESGPGEMREQVWIGLMSIVGGLAPVIAANRHIILPDFSRYTMIASVGAVILLVAFIEKFPMRSLRMGAACFLVTVAVLTHYGNSVKAAADTEIVRNFWWQVAWRAPQIRAGTTLSASYPAAAIQEDYFIWGPANHIYYPNGQHTGPVTVDLAGIVLDEDNIARILAGRGERSFYKRGDVQVVNDFRNVLVITQSDENACVRILDGTAPELSVYDQQRIMLIAPHSRLDDVVPAGKAPVPPPLIFGAEPPHTWCFYYQAASLARQQGDWHGVIKFYAEALKLSLHPNDQIELMPFLQAYAFLGDQKQVKNLSTRINTHPFYTEQACHSLAGMAERGYPLTPEMQTYADKLFCN